MEMEEFMKVNGTMTKKKALELKSFKIKIYMKANTISEGPMEKGGTRGPMERPMKGSGSMGSNMARAPGGTKSQSIMKESGSSANLMGMESKGSKTGIFMKANIKTNLNMAEEKRLSQIKTSTLGIMSMVNPKVSANINGLMAIFTKVSSKVV